MEAEFHDQGQAPFLRDALKLVVESVTFTPIVEKRRGSTVDVSISGPKAGPRSGG